MSKYTVSPEIMVKILECIRKKCNGDNIKRPWLMRAGQDEIYFLPKSSCPNYYIKIEGMTYVVNITEGNESFSTYETSFGVPKGNGTSSSSKKNAHA